MRSPLAALKTIEVLDNAFLRGYGQPHGAGSYG